MMTWKANTHKKFDIFETATRSAADTHLLGSTLATWIPVPSVILLQGALGTGKTTLTRGIAHGLGLNDPSRVSSPSFALVNIYEGDCRIYHVDLYRLSGDRELYTTGIDDFLGVDGVSVVEWSDRLVFPVEAAFKVELRDGGGDLRLFRIFCDQRLGMRASYLATCIGNGTKIRKTTAKGRAFRKFSV
ncbi:MAG: yjeE [Acidobacteria bacterium]|jgi:tRNA threonylcarbamoyladenosine biosynthesis protein TsaE|nr:yjeE [Acidobacteriota bacterium]